MRGKGWLRPDDPALALQAVEQGGLLTADISPRAHPQLELEGVSGAADIRAKIAGLAGYPKSFRKCPCSMRIFRTAVDVALGRADADAADRHALDQGERIALHDHPVGKSAAVAFVGIADDIFAIGRGVGGSL